MGTRMQVYIVILNFSPHAVDVPIQNNIQFILGLQQGQQVKNTNFTDSRQLYKFSLQRVTV